MAAGRTVADDAARSFTARLLPASRRQPHAGADVGGSDSRRPLVFDASRRRHSTRAGDLRNVGVVPDARGRPVASGANAAARRHPRAFRRRCNARAFIAFMEDWRSHARRQAAPALQTRVVPRQRRPRRRSAAARVFADVSIRLRSDVDRAAAARPHRPLAHAARKPRPRVVVSPRPRASTNGCCTTSTVRPLRRRAATVAASCIRSTARSSRQRCRNGLMRTR